MYIAGLDVVGGLVGGAVIGVASSALLWLTGNITGISGIVHSTITGRPGGGKSWRSTYIFGLVVTGIGAVFIKPSVFGPPTTIKPVWAVVAGLLVGFGTRLGNGCTSGHGVCGIPRLSPRSLAAVGTFMATGAATATLVRHPNVRSAFFNDKPLEFLPGTADGMHWANLTVALPALALVAASFVIFHRSAWVHSFVFRTPVPVQSTPAHTTTAAQHLASFASSVAFGVGLAVSGMTSPERVQAFLDFTGVAGWNPTLMLVMGGAVAVNLLTFRLLRRKQHPVLADDKTFDKIIQMGACPANRSITTSLIVGSALFGMGWGLGGFCPGPAIVSVAGMRPGAGVMIAGMLAGMMVYEAVLGEGLFPHKPRQHAPHKHAEHTHGHHHGRSHDASSHAPAPAAAAVADPTTQLLSDDAKTAAGALRHRTVAAAAVDA